MLVADNDALELIRRAIGEELDKRLGKDERWRTVAQVAEQVGVHTVTVRGWIRTGRLPAEKAGRGWRIRESDIPRALEPKTADKNPEALAAERWGRRRA